MKNFFWSASFFQYCRKVKDNPIQSLENNSIDNLKFASNNNYSEYSSSSSPSKVQEQPEKNGKSNFDEVDDVDKVQSNYNSVEGYNEINMENSIETIIDFDFSWRNFFTAINFLRIAQKLTKKKTHRILLLVQYKSSVSWKLFFFFKLFFYNFYNLIVYNTNFRLFWKKFSRCHTHQWNCML